MVFSTLSASGKQKCERYTERTDTHGYIVPIYTPSRLEVRSETVYMIGIPDNSQRYGIHVKADPVHDNTRSTSEYTPTLKERRTHNYQGIPEGGGENFIEFDITTEMPR